MADEIAALVTRLARLELELTDERRAREVAAAEAVAARQAAERLARDMADGIGRVDARLLAVAERLSQLETGLDAARTWLADLTRHLETTQKEANGWVAAEQEARTALEASLGELRERQAVAEQGGSYRPERDRALRAEVTALGHLLDDLSAAVFPTPGQPRTA